MDGDVLERYYQERLEERLIAYLAERLHVSLKKAMDIYYRSGLAQKIHEGRNGIQYLDYRVLAGLLLKTEPELIG